MNRKSKIIFTIIVVAVLIGGGIYLWQQNNAVKETNVGINQNYEISTNSERQSNYQKPSEEWREVNHANFWGQPNLFANPDYKFANIKFSYPDNWKFSCCNDREEGSTHIIYSSLNLDTSLPYIKIMDFALSGCPDVNKSCSIDETVKKIPEEKFNDLIQTIPNDAQILPKLSLNNLNSDAFVYVTTDNEGRGIKSFIIKTADDVIEISFVNHKLLESEFINIFLDKIENELTCTSDSDCTGLEPDPKWGTKTCWYQCPVGPAAGIPGSLENPGVCKACPPSV